MKLEEMLARLDEIERDLLSRAGLKQALDLYQDSCVRLSDMASYYAYQLTESEERRKRLVSDNKSLRNQVAGLQEQLREAQKEAREARDVARAAQKEALEARQEAEWERSVHAMGQQRLGSALRDVGSISHY